MFKNSLVISYLLMLKDNEINENAIMIHSLLQDYINKKISKKYLLDKHTERNKLFKDWFIIYEYS